MRRRMTKNLLGLGKWISPLIHPPRVWFLPFKMMYSMVIGRKEGANPSCQGG